MLAAALLLAGACLAASTVHAQVPYDRILKAAAEPHNWLTYNGTYNSQRYSTLTQITPENVTRLESKWVLQNQVFGAWQSNPLVVDGVMYLTERPNDVMAVDAKTGRMFWLYRWTPSPTRASAAARTTAASRSSATRSTWARSTRHLIAIDAKTGKPLWNVTVADVKLAYSITLAPLIIKDKVIVGVGGGEFGIRGFIAAYDAKTGKEAWRFNTIPGPGEQGHETWDEDDWKSGGALGVGDRLVRSGSEPHLLGHRQSRARLESRTSGPATTCTPTPSSRSTPTPAQLKWHFQFTPNDGYDYDSVQIPVLADINWKGTPTKVMMWANRNGYFYVLDRANGQVPAR